MHRNILYTEADDSPQQPRFNRVTLEMFPSAANGGSLQNKSVCLFIAFHPTSVLPHASCQAGANSNRSTCTWGEEITMTCSMDWLSTQAWTIRMMCIIQNQFIRKAPLQTF